MRRQSNGHTVQKERTWREAKDTKKEEKETEGRNMQRQLCVGRDGGRRRPSKSASLLSTPPSSSPPGASEASELRITNGRHWPGKKL